MTPKQRTFWKKPASAMSTTLMIPGLNMMALGGVATGNMNAKGPSINYGHHQEGGGQPGGDDAVTTRWPTGDVTSQLQICSHANF